MGNVAEDDAVWSVECRRTTGADNTGFDADDTPICSCLRMDDGVADEDNADDDDVKDKDCSEPDEAERRRRVAAG
jgi:hypothetical protein